jgi:hypothetical protein
MAVNGTLGSKLFITDAAIASTIDTEAEFMAQTYTEVGLIESFGEFGRQFELASFQAVADGRTHKLKAGFNDGQVQFTLGQDLADAGQALLKAAAEASSQANFGFRIEMNDPPSAVGGPTTFFFRGLAMSYRTQMGAANAVVKAMTALEVNSDIIHVYPAELYDRFITGGSLAHYELFNGADAQAADPVISGNALVCVSGDAGTGFALVVEARLKLSAITTASLFFGLTDQKAALEIPIESAASGNTITTNATDAVGFMFDTEMTADNVWLVGVNNGSDETPQNSAAALSADTYTVLRMEIAANGDTVFKRDGAVVGSTMSTAVATGVPLYPTIAVGSRATSSRTATLDYLYVRQG